MFCKLDLGTFIATFVLEVLFYQIESVFKQKKSTTCNNNDDMHSIFDKVTYQKRIWDVGEIKKPSDEKLIFQKFSYPPN